jgi:hypothetical protein
MRPKTISTFCVRGPVTAVRSLPIDGTVECEHETTLAAADTRRRWFWHLDDGHPPTGPYASRNAAMRAGVRGLAVAHDQAR